MTRSIFFAAALSFVTLSAGAVHAQEQAQARQPEQVAVSTRHVDFANDRQARSFYGRIQAAAHQVCTSDVSDPLTADADAACERDAVADAVRQAGAPKLSQVHERSDQAPAYAAHNTGTRNN